MVHAILYNKNKEMAFEQKLIFFLYHVAEHKNGIKIQTVPDFHFWE